MILLEPYFWVLATLLAALGQSLRSVIQKNSRAEMGIYGSAFVRFFYGLPASLLLVIWLVDPADVQVHAIPPAFFYWLLPAAMIQILFTIVLGYAFEQRNFATSIALSKTDAIQAAFFELLLLSIIPDIKVVVAITVGFIAIYLISQSKYDHPVAGTVLSRSRSVFIGLFAGLCLGSCSVFFRIAMDLLPGLDIVDKAIFTSCLSTLLQVLIMGACLWIWRPNELMSCLRGWQISLVAGTIAAVTTFMWFVAFGMKGVAPVRMLGQVEILFSLAFSVWFFKERVRRLEVVGAAMIIISVWILLS